MVLLFSKKKYYFFFELFRRLDGSLSHQFAGAGSLLAAHRDPGLESCAAQTSGIRNGHRFSRCRTASKPLFTVAGEIVKSKHAVHRVLCVALQAIKAEGRQSSGRLEAKLSVILRASNCKLAYVTQSLYAQGV